MEVKVNIIDTLFTTIPKDTVVASYTVDEDNVQVNMASKLYYINKPNKTIHANKNINSNNIEAIHFTVRNWVSGEQVEINDMYPRVVSKLQNKFNKPNTIYKVTKDLDLNHRVLTIPEGCTLQFDGGSISNGYIEGSILNDVIDLNKIRVNDLGIFFSYFELRDGQTLILEKNKVYISSTDININASNISINGNGATIQSTNTTQLSNIIKVSPQITAYSGLNINATVGSTTVSLGNIASSIQIGDHIQIRDSANRLNLNYHNGIYAIVVDKKDNTITLDIPYNSDIITNIEVYKPLYNVKIFDLTLGFNDSHGQRGIRLVKCRNSEIYNIKADGLGNLSGIYIDDCYYTKVHDCVLSKFFDIDRIVNMNGYGIGASGRDIEIYNNNVYDCRHCYAGDSRDYTSFIHIHDNTASYSYNTYAELNGIQPVIYAGMYDLHGNNKGIIENNIGTTTLLESGKWYGITVRESDVIIRNNTIENNSNTFEGLAIILSELAYNNILIENNKITGRVAIGSVVTNLQLINNIFNDSFIDFSTISDNTEKSINILYNKFYINNATRTTPIIQGKEQNYNYNIQGNIFIDEYNISSSVINISALASSVYIDNNLFILNNKTSANVIIFPSSQITTFDLKSTISNNKFIVPNLPQTVDITNYWRGKYFSNYDSRLDSVVRNINILENTSQLPALGRTILEGTLFLCRDTHKIYVYNYNRYSGLDGRLMDVPFATNYANVSTVLSSLDSYKDVGLTLYITDRKQFVTYNGTTFIRTDGYEYNSTTVRIPSQLSEIEVSNCIYRIIYNFDLNGETLTLPSNCTLDFQGGSFSNGNIVFRNTKIIADKDTQIFNNISFSNLYEISIKWFGAKGDGVTDDTNVFLAICNKEYTRENQLTVHIPVGVYVISQPINPNAFSDENYTFQNWIGEGTKISPDRIYDKIKSSKTRTVLYYTGNSDLAFINAVSSISNITIRGKDNGNAAGQYTLYPEYDNTIGINISVEDQNSYASQRVLDDVQILFFGTGIKQGPSFSITMNNVSMQRNGFGYIIDTTPNLSGMYITYMKINNIFISTSKYTGLKISSTLSNKIIFDGFIIQKSNGTNLEGYYDLDVSSGGASSIEFLSGYMENAGSTRDKVTANINSVISMKDTVLHRGTYKFKGGVIENSQSTDAIFDLQNTSITLNNIRAYDIQNYGNYDSNGYVLVTAKGGNINNNKIINSGTTGINFYKTLFEGIEITPLIYNPLTHQFWFRAGDDEITFPGNLFGDSNNRPTSNRIGTMYFDTTLNKYICWNGIKWINLDGTALT